MFCKAWSQENFKHAYRLCVFQIVYVYSVQISDSRNSCRCSPVVSVMSKPVCKTTNNPAFKSVSLHEYGMLLSSITLVEERTIILVIVVLFVFPTTSTYIAFSCCFSHVHLRLWITIWCMLHEFYRAKIAFIWLKFKKASWLSSQHIVCLYGCQLMKHYRLLKNLLDINQISSIHYSFWQ